MSKVYTAEEVAQHNKESDCWLILHGKVYNVTGFLSKHPGGKAVIMKLAGKDATVEFDTLHNGTVLDQYGTELCVGTVGTAAEARGGGAGGAGGGVATGEGTGGFGEAAGTVYGEPYWYREGLRSAYYGPGHAEFRQKVREFVEKELRPWAGDWDEQGAYPLELHGKAYRAGVLAAAWPQQHGGTPPAGGFDAFHDLILVDELARCGAGGLLWAVFFSFGIALPPILSVGSQFLRDKVARPVISGEKIMSLAVTEPYAGSDVAGLRTTARREGDFYIVNGEKKFITSGTRAHYFTTAVRTGGPGMKGISLLLIEADSPGLTVRRQKTQGWWTSSTAYLTFENVKVPVAHLIGKENDGFGPIMINFNHERFVFAATSNRWARVCLEDAIKYAQVRQTFGKRLIDHPVRITIARMQIW
jgi:alkylation response protein AidB-like acyl-CoA dehydrogenase